MDPLDMFDEIGDLHVDKEMRADVDRLVREDKMLSKELDGIHEATQRALLFPAIVGIGGGIAMLVTGFMLMCAPPAKAGQPGPDPEWEQVPGTMIAVKREPRVDTHPAHEPHHVCALPCVRKPAPSVSSPDIPADATTPEDPLVRSGGYVFEVRGGAGTSPLLGAALYKRKGSLRFGVSLDYIRTERASATTECYSGYMKVGHHWKPYAACTADASTETGEALALARIQLVPHRDGIRPYVGTGVGVLGSQFAYDVDAGLSVPLQYFEVTAGYRHIGGPQSQHVGVLGVRFER